jgi:hypothetical protein
MYSFGKAVAAVACGVLICQMCACVSSNLVDLWHDPSFVSAPLNNILVIAVRKDATKRRIWEDAFTGGLAQHGVTATSSYSLFPDIPPDTDQVISTVETNRFDGILVILRLPTQVDAQYVHGYTTTAQYERYSSYWQRYRTYYQEIEYPGYIDSQTVDIRSIDVTTTGKKGRMIWSAKSRTPDPGSVTDAQQGIAVLVINELAQRSIIRLRK